MNRIAFLVALLLCSVARAQFTVAGGSDDEIKDQRGADITLYANGGGRVKDISDKVVIDGKIVFSVPVRGLLGGSVTVDKRGEVTLARLNGKAPEHRSLGHHPCLRAMLERYLLFATVANGEAVVWRDSKLLRRSGDFQFSSGAGSSNGGSAGSIRFVEADKTVLALDENNIASA